MPASTSAAEGAARARCAGPQQPVEAPRVIGVGQHAGEATVEHLLLLYRLRIERSPGRARDLLRARDLARGDQRVGVALGSRQGQRFVVREPGEDRRSEVPSSSACSARLPEQPLRWPLRIVDDEAGDLGETSRRRSSGWRPARPPASPPPGPSHGWRAVRLRPVAAIAGGERRIESSDESSARKGTEPPRRHAASPRLSKVAETRRHQLTFAVEHGNAAA